VGEIIMEIKSRNGIVHFLNTLIKTGKITGTAVEIGVANGTYALYNLNHWKGEKYVMVDPWRRYQDWTDLGSYTDDILEAAYLSVTKETMNNSCAVIHRTFSVSAAALYPDNYFDWVFIDGNHDYEYVKKDILSWWPKYKSGGCFGGHDYIGWDGVKRAVDELVRDYNLNLHILEECGSWYV
jgi:hypothetical protein